MRRTIMGSVILMVIFGIWECSSPLSYISIQGETMGTYYALNAGQNQEIVSQREIDSLLFQLNLALSTYINRSLISRFNQADSTFDLKTVEEVSLRTYFSENVEMAVQIHQISQGYFDPTVMPLVNYWGFGYEEHKLDSLADTTLVQNKLSLIGMHKISWADSEHTIIKKASPGMELDFSALAKGYAIDVVGSYLEEEKGITNYMIDIGGEVLAKGKNQKGKFWRIGINTPKEDALLSEIDAILTLENTAVATSGNYRNFYTLSDGTKVSHTINPKTGFPERNQLLSASIVTSTCGWADGMATACMAMGLDGARNLISNRAELEGILIYNEGGIFKKYISDGLKPYYSQP